MSHRVDDAIEQALSQQRLVGVVVLIAKDGEVAYRRAAGFADREAHLPMREDTVFRLSSLTKPIVSAVAMALVEQNLLDLSDVAARWLPQFRPKTPQGAEAVITLRQLLTHTAGLSYGFFEPDDGPYHRAGVSDGLAEPGLSMREELARLASVPLLYAPGSAWGYSLGLDVLGEIMRRATGTSLPALVEELVTTPLRCRTPDSCRATAASCDSVRGWHTAAANEDPESWRSEQARESGSRRRESSITALSCRAAPAWSAQRRIF